MRRAGSVAVAVAVALLAGGCSVVGGGGGSYELVATFDRTINLFESSDVRVLGLPAGTVTDITVAGDAVEVTLRIDDDVPVPADVQATIVPFSLIGERYVQLFPAWTRGQPRAADGAHIPLERTSVPVEPDEALAALKELMDSLDAEGTGRLVGNLGEALGGQGESLNRALAGLGTLVGTLGDESDELAGIIEHFDELTATLATREAQLGEVLDGFAAATSTLAAERRSIEALIGGLATLSSDGLALVAEHDEALAHDLDVLGRALRSVDVNLERVGDLLDAGPLLVEGLSGAYNATYHRIDLRNQASPTVSQALEKLGIPVPSVCLPIDVDCQTEAPSPATATAPARASDPVAGAPAAAPAGPPVVVPTAGGDGEAALPRAVVGVLAPFAALARLVPAPPVRTPGPTELAAAAGTGAPEPSFLGRVTRSLLGVGR